MPVLPSISQCLTASRHISPRNLLLNKLSRTSIYNRHLSSTAIRLKNKDCEPIKMKLCKPKCQKKRPPKPACETLKQPLWEGCDNICMPCCENITTPLTCDYLDVKLNYCKKEEYRLPSYSECNKDYSYPRRKKECCYHMPICHLGTLREREIRPLIRIKDRQARVLGREKH